MYNRPYFQTDRAGKVQLLLIYLFSAYTLFLYTIVITTYNNHLNTLEVIGVYYFFYYRSFISYIIYLHTEERYNNYQSQQSYCNIQIKITNIYARQDCEDCRLRKVDELKAVLIEFSLSMAFQ